MTAVANITGYVAANEELVSPKSNKAYRLITVKYDTGYYSRENKWIKTGVNVYRLRVHRPRTMRQAAEIQVGDEIMATLTSFEVKEVKDQEGNTHPYIAGNADKIGVISRKQNRASAAPSPMQQAKDEARNAQDRGRARQASTETTGTEGTPKQTPEEYRAEQTRLGVEAAAFQNAQKAKKDADAAKPQPSDVTACKRCGEPKENAQLNRNGRCSDCHGKRGPVAEPVTANA